MTRFLIYLFPAAIDLAMACTAFVCSVRGANAGWEPSRIASLFIVWAVVYMFVCQVVARIVTPQNAPRFLIVACVVLAATSAGFVRFAGLHEMHYLMVPMAIGTGLFFAPFQVFMKAFDQARARSVAYSSGIFLFAWSAGFAIGPFVAGFIWKYYGWQTCYSVNIVMAIGTAVGVYLLQRHGHEHDAPRAAKRAIAPVGKPLDYSRMPNLAWLGWLCGGLSIASFAMLKTLIPVSGVEYRMSEPEIGTIFFVASAVRALTGLLLCRSKTWMYRPFAVGAFGLFGIAGMLVVATAEGPWGFGCAAALHGIYLGSFFFYLTFHSLIHPTRSSRYVSINESVVGAANIAGPFLGGFLAGAYGLQTAYLAGAGVVLVVVIVQGVVNSRHAECVRELRRR
ncbi:MAG: MFS transporter [Planctomycetes bacterium]|nr:MFS transporter [Planctomycetota bacterium]